MRTSHVFDEFVRIFIGYCANHPENKSATVTAFGGDFYPCRPCTSSSWQREANDAEVFDIVKELWALEITVFNSAPAVVINSSYQYDDGCRRGNLFFRRWHPNTHQTLRSGILLRFPCDRYILPSCQSCHAAGVPPTLNSARSQYMFIMVEIQPYCPWKLWSSI